MMLPEGGAGGSGGVRQGGIDLLLLYRDNRQMLSDPLFPLSLSLSLSLILSPSKIGLFPDLSDLGETARQSTIVSQLGLSPSPSP